MTPNEIQGAVSPIPTDYIDHAKQQIIQHWPEMGNKLKESSIFSKTAMSPIGSVSICPNCQQSFPPSTTYENFDQHVTLCLESFRPTDQERLRMQRRKKSKDSVGSKSSDGDDDKHDYITIQVYVRKKHPENNAHKTPPQQKRAELSQKKTDSATQKRNREIDNKLVGKAKWIKSHLTYSQSLLTSLSLSEISKQGTAYKILWLHHRIAAQRITWKEGAEVLTFHPDRIVKDSLGLTTKNLYKELKIVVLNDVVHDAGGLLREWAAMLLQGLIVQFGLFVRNKEGYYTLNPELSSMNKLKSRVSWADGKGAKQKQRKGVGQNAKFDKKQMKFPSAQMWEQDFQIYKMYYNNHMLNEEQGYTNNPMYNSTRSQAHNSPINYSNVTYTHLYELFACLLAKMLIEKVTVPVTFDWLFLAGLRVKTAPEMNLEALSTYDKQIYQTMQYLHNLSASLKNPKSPSFKDKFNQLQSLWLTFSVPAGRNSPEYELVPNGKKTPVSSPEQLEKYIKCLQHYYANVAHEGQQKIIKQKFYSIIKPEIFNNLLSCEELELLINGVNGESINVRDWQQGTEYRQPYNKQHKVIKYFWSTVEKMSGDDKMRLLKFVTGSERLPVYGFKNLQTNRGQTSHFVIEAVKYDKKMDALPKAHTCFNRLVLPTYPNEATLAQCLLAVLHSNFDGIWGME